MPQRLARGTGAAPQGASSAPPETHLQRFGYEPAFPTALHQAACESVVDYLSQDARACAVLLTCSCARGQGVPESCVDLCVLVASNTPTALVRSSLRDWAAYVSNDPACVALDEATPWSGIDLAVSDGTFRPDRHGYTTGPDALELDIGNTLAWAHPLFRRDTRWEALLKEHLPYYDDVQRQEKLSRVLAYCRNNIDHILPYARRQLWFQAQQRTIHASQEFLQALFLARRLYPIAYDKWVQEQLVDILDEPAMYDALTRVLELRKLSLPEFACRARTLTRLVDALPTPSSAGHPTSAGSPVEKEQRSP